MRAKRREKERQVPTGTDQSNSQDKDTASHFDLSENENDDQMLESPSPSDRLSTEFQRTINHPLHTISTSPKPLPIGKWALLQNPKDIPHNMVRVPKEELKKEMPNDLIVFRDRNGRKRILVPKNQRTALTQTEHETMLHVKGNRVSHELSRSYFWPKMT